MALPARTKDAKGAMDEARAALAKTNDRIAELTRRRLDLLLADDNRSLDALDAELDTLKKTAARGTDRILALEAEVRRAEAEAVAKRRVDLTARFEKTLSDADAEADLLQEDLVRVEARFRKIIALRETARAAWPVGASSTNASAGTPEGAALSGAAVAALLKYELFRIGTRPFLGGHPGARGEVSFPGGACPQIQWAMTPEKITPLAEALRRASAFAVDMMRGKLDPIAALPPSPATAGTPAEQKLSSLLARQARLAVSTAPEDEVEYQNVVAEIATAQDEIAAARNGAAA
jgi:hypothetical protein